MNLAKLHKIAFYLSSAALIFAFAFLLNTIGNPKHQALAQSPSDQSTLSGYAWSSTIGWISFSGPISSGGNYQVNIASSTGNLSGYAWSSNIGWVQFGGLSGFPAGNGTTASNARYTGTDFTGWFRAVSAIGRTDGWDGWLSLKGNANDGGVYSVSVSNNDVSGVPGAKYLTGFAWGADVVGWVDMHQVYINLSPPPPVDVCPNIAGVQTTVPPGYVIDPVTGNCVPQTPIPTSPPNPDPVANLVPGTGCTYDVVVTWTVEPNTSYVLKRGANIIYQGTGGQGTETGLTPGQSYKYDLTATNAYGSATKSASITLPAGCPAVPPIIANFVPVPPAVSEGGQCSLVWTGIQHITMPPDTCVITGPGLNYSLNSPYDGSTLSAPIYASSRYTLTCSNSTGTASRQATCSLKPKFIEF